MRGGADADEGRREERARGGIAPVACCRQGTGKACDSAAQLAARLAEDSAVYKRVGGRAREVEASARKGKADARKGGSGGMCGRAGQELRSVCSAGVGHGESRGQGRMEVGPHSRKTVVYCMMRSRTPSRQASRCRLRRRAQALRDALSQVS